MSKSFLQYYDGMFPPPVEYNMAQYQISSDLDSVQSRDNGCWELTPIPERGLASVEEVGKWMSQHGRNTTKLGRPMSDEEFHAFYGLPTARRTGR